jgi:hypothetical protein
MDPHLGDATGATALRYEAGEITVAIHQEITEDVFRAVGEILGEPLGRFKGWSTLYVFTPKTADACTRLTEYLRRSGVTHSVEIEWHWNV